MVLLFFVGIGVAQADKIPNLFKKDCVLETDPKATEKTGAAVTDESKSIGTLKVSPTSELADDGSLIYNITDQTGKVLSSYNYAPWKEKFPAYKELSNGDIIFGSSFIYSKKDQTLSPLAGIAGLSYIFDYAVGNNELALIGKKDIDTVPKVYICVLDTNGEVKSIDSFSYPEYNPGEIYAA